MRKLLTVFGKQAFKPICLMFFSLVISLPVYSADTSRHRVIVSSDIGGTDPDDFQSMVHILLYADVLDIEGLIASPYEKGRKKDILDVIAFYARDYPNLRSYSERYPTPDALRAITKQGALEVAPYRGFRDSTEGSRWIVSRARDKDPRPLHVLVWGGIEDLAQALHDAPDILPKLRVHYIGGPNKKWGPDAYHYLATQHPDLFIIESNATYRGWFVGGNQKGEWGNTAFVRKHIAGHGALGEFFTTQLGGAIKMGDTPTVSWLLHGNPADPSQAGWGGNFVRAWKRPYKVFERLTTAADQLEEFGVFELVLPLGANAPDKPEARMHVENQKLLGYVDGEGNIRFRFTPKAAKVYPYTLHGNVPSLAGKTGALTSVPTSPAMAKRPDPALPNWWVDNPAPEFAEPPHIGVKTVNRWREDFLGDFAKRMDRAQAPKKMSSHTRPASDAKRWGDSYLALPAHWYATREARKLADNIMDYQSSAGAWPKNMDLTAPATQARLKEARGNKANTLDNDATTRPMRFIARVAHATGEDKYKVAFALGLDYLFAAQYENGGWPQFFPLRPRGYYSHITYNDNAMMNAMFLLRDVSRGRAPYSFVDENRVARAVDAVDRGIACILKTQIKQGGKLTAWSAQYDRETLAPTWARNFEPPTQSGQESVAIVRFLMEIEEPSAEVIAAIEGAVSWLKGVAVTGLRYQFGPNAKGEKDSFVTPDPGADTLWARFYELGTDRPVFTGRDKVIRYSLEQVEQERRGGYAYYGQWPATLLTEDYPRWKRKRRMSLSAN